MKVRTLAPKCARCHPPRGVVTAVGPRGFKLALAHGSPLLPSPAREPEG